MSKHINLNEIEIGQTYSGVYLVKSHSVKMSKANKEYLDIILVDRTGEISGKWWNIQNFDCNTIVDSDFIVLKYLVEEYNGNKQLRIQAMKHLTPDMTFDPSDIIPMSPEDPNALFNELYETANNFVNTDLKKIVTTILNERKVELLKMPGAKSVHHAVIGGLLLHTAGMLRSAKALASVYPNINKELLYAGVILHDVCKLDEFSAGPIGIVNDYTTQGKLLGHLYMGAAYVERKGRELAVSPEVTLCLSHMILSHHGEPEYGSAVRPMFVEAALLHMIDLIDARVYMFNDITKDLEDNTFSQKAFALDNVQVYKHNLNKEDSHIVDFSDLPTDLTEDMF